MVAVANVTLWSCRRIPYVFENGYPHQRAVRKAMDQWESAAGVKFVPRLREESHLIIRDGGGNSSPVGMVGGPQHVLIASDYLALHELGHALGLIHEQCRTDRDQYVEIKWSSIIDAERNAQFGIVNDSKALSPYDPASVMHYPAPAIGWQGIPADQEVRTMNWKRHNMTLGASDWRYLSTLDRSGGLYEHYQKVPVPMGSTTDRTKHHGSHNRVNQDDYDDLTQLTFTVGGRVFYYTQYLKGRRWQIQELLPGGRFGDYTDHGSWGHYYQAVFSFTSGDRVFLYAQCQWDNKAYFVRELLPGGIMGLLTERGTLPTTYSVVFPYTIGDRTFYYGQNINEPLWLIRELLPGGKLGRVTDTGQWKYWYQTQFPFNIEGRQFFFGQNLGREKNWFIHELLPEGRMGSETDKGHWHGKYDIGFAYKFPKTGKVYMYGHDYRTNFWFIQRLQPGGEMGDELQTGYWGNWARSEFAFEVGGRMFIYHKSAKYKDKTWIKELIDA
ncbi:hypothetical protein QBC35DRAFT_540674 [Podospora australis]|uniref:Metalloendopeptidase n=1 Tax=Podospora australis TaxID=1536484 RepID=A0AAN6WLR9_9PEZI|nr:hypothetical protein QBC35DRAFT_540674 [Podospora australis]